MFEKGMIEMFIIFVLCRLMLELVALSGRFATCTHTRLYLFSVRNTSQKDSITNLHQNIILGVFLQSVTKFLSERVSLF